MNKTYNVYLKRRSSFNSKLPKFLKSFSVEILQDVDIDEQIFYVGRVYLGNDPVSFFTTCTENGEYAEFDCWDYIFENYKPM